MGLRIVTAQGRGYLLSAFSDTASLVFPGGTDEPSPRGNVPANDDVLDRRLGKVSAGGLGEMAVLHERRIEP
jgi:hypothetical protein